MNEEIKQLIKSQGRSNKWIAKQMGFSVQTLSNKLTGATDWTLDEVDKIAKILDTDRLELLKKA